MVQHDLTITKKDSVYLRVECERSVAKELSEFFTFKVPNYQYTPAFKNKIWDGQIRLYNVHTQTLYVGLLDYLVDFANDRNYKMKVDLPISNISINKESIENYLISKLNLPFTPHEHQVNAIQHAIENKRALLLSPTGSGKSLIIYSLMRYYLSKINEEKKILVIVPTTSLVSQMMSDFRDYSKQNGFDVDQECHYIMSGQEKETDKRVVVSTWQSIYKEREKWFDQFEAVFGDECHLFKSKSLTSIMSKLKNCDYRIGTTGTLDGSHTHKLVIEGLFGCVKKVITTKDLMDKSLLSSLKIDQILLNYPDSMKQETKRAKYQDEIKWIVQNPKRNEFIVDLASKLKGNTLLLFQFVEKHGMVLYNDLKAKKDKTFLIHGGTDVDQRENIRKILDNEIDNATLIASYGTCSTGINIRNIHNIIFASPSRSVIRVLQSIGRGLRKSNSKDKVKLYDIADDLCVGKYQNHTYRHMQERQTIYSNERFESRMIVIDVSE